MSSLKIAWALLLLVLGPALLFGRVLRASALSKLSRRNRMWAFVAAAALVGFALVPVLFLTLGSPLAADQGWHDRVGGHSGDPCLPLMQRITDLGDWRWHIVALVIALPFCWKTQSRTLVLQAVAYLATASCVVGVKDLFERARPADRLVMHLDASYPSGHSAEGMAFFLGLAVLLSRTAPSRRKLWFALAALVVLAIGFSRTYLRVHWLTDVLGGWCIALFWFAASRLGDSLADS